MFSMMLPTYCSGKRSGVVIVGLPGTGKTSFARRSDPNRFIDFDVKIGTFVKGDHARYDRAAYAITSLFDYFTFNCLDKRPFIATHIEVITPLMMAQLLLEKWNLVVCASAGDTAHVQSVVNSNIQRCIARGDSESFINDYRQHGIEWNAGTLQWLANVHTEFKAMVNRTSLTECGSVCLVEDLIWAEDDPLWEINVDRKAIINMYHADKQFKFDWFD